MHASPVETVYNKVLSNVGARLPTVDSVDRRIKSNVRNRLGSFFNGVGYPAEPVLADALGDAAVAAGGQPWTSARSRSASPSRTSRPREPFTRSSDSRRSTERSAGLADPEERPGGDRALPGDVRAEYPHLQPRLGPGGAPHRSVHRCPRAPARAAGGSLPSTRRPMSRPPARPASSSPIRTATRSSSTSIADQAPATLSRVERASLRRMPVATSRPRS